MPPKNNNYKNGYVLIITILITSLMLFLGLYLSSLAITENTITHSHARTLQSYYLAEAGLQNMIFKIQNNIDDYDTNFKSDPAWSTTFTQSNPFDPSTSYEVSIANLNTKAFGEIVSTGFVDLPNGTTAQRVVKVTIFKALGTDMEDWQNKGALANGNIDISLSKVNFMTGDVFSNINFTINGGGTEVYVKENLNVVGNILVTNANLTIDGEAHASNYNPPGPDEIQIPAIDFDSEDPASYLNIADKVYTENEFSDLMLANQDLTLNDPITYVDGNVELLGGQSLTLNGLLIIGNDLYVGKTNCWEMRCGVNNIIINHPPNVATGIFAKRKINMYEYTGEVSAYGLIYANDEININNIPESSDYSFNVYGAIFSRKLTITSCWQPLNIYYDADTVSTAFNVSPFSSIITVEHWEEEY